MERLTKRHGKHAVQIGAETRRNDPGWQRLAEIEDLAEQGRLVELPYDVKIGDTIYDAVLCDDGNYRIVKMEVGLL
ncbi:hypothetical protein [Hominibacterium faecale]|uniref:hypothetical protein n=1 Tax=Hominibacterium faecale TaxID=2839743 RepID=UPI0022B2AB54|nr:hypothetical protein [Hominibacterium faecale]